jgi:hypothetical protein
VFEDNADAYAVATKGVTAGTLGSCKNSRGNDEASGVARYDYGNGSCSNESITSEIHPAMEFKS